jgi:hypothetical protein
MAHYRDPRTAPRDGTIIIGLFARPGRRAYATRAAFQVDDALIEEIDPAWPDWQREMAIRHADRVRNDPLGFFRPLNEDADTGLELGRMVGWRPDQVR